MGWIISNLATIIVGLLLLVVVIFAIRTLVKDRKKSGCSGECTCCSCARKCYSQKQSKVG